MFVLHECVINCSTENECDVTEAKSNFNVRNIIKTMKAIVFPPNFNAIIPGRGVTEVTEFCLLYL